MGIAPFGTSHARTGPLPNAQMPNSGLPFLKERGTISPHVDRGEWL